MMGEPRWTRDRAYIIAQTRYATRTPQTAHFPLSPR